MRRFSLRKSLVVCILLVYGIVLYSFTASDRRPDVLIECVDCDQAVTVAKKEAAASEGARAGYKGYKVMYLDGSTVPLKTHNLKKVIAMIGKRKQALTELNIPFATMESLETWKDEDPVIQEPVIATAFSSNHYTESKILFSHLLEHVPNLKVIVYNLGLNPEEVSEVESTLAKFQKKGEIRQFNFRKYEKYNPRVTDLHTYAWKALLIQEVFAEYGFVFYMDTSFRILSPRIQQIFAFLRNFGIGYWENGLMHVCFTHPDMFSYFNVTPSEFADEMAFDATAGLFYNRSITREVTLAAYVACSLDSDCMSPSGSSVGGCNSQIQTQNVYCGCHRFDQSAITLILSMIFQKPRFTFADPSTESNYAPYALQDKPGGREQRIVRTE